MRYFLTFLSLAAASVLLSSGCASTGTSKALQDPGPNYLPGGTQLWVGMSNPEAFAKSIERDALVERVVGKPEYAQFQREVERDLGFDPFDPASMKRAGFDTTKPFGMMMVNFGDELGGGYAHIADIATFTSTLDRFAAGIRGKRSSESIGAGTVHTFGDGGKRKRVCVAVHKNFAMILLTDRSKSIERMRKGCYSAAAGGDARTALGKSTAFRRTLQQLAHARDLYGYANTSSLLNRRRAYEDPDSGHLQERVKADAESVRRFYNDTAGLGFGLDVTPTGALVDIRMVLQPSAKKLSLVSAAASRTSGTLSTGVSMFDIGVSFDPAQGVEGLLLGLGANPLASMAMGFFGSQLTQSLVDHGLDPKKDLSATLNGIAGITAECAAGDGRERGECGMALYFELKDAAQAKDLLQPPKQVRRFEWVEVIGKRLVMGFGDRARRMASNPAKPVSAPATLAAIVDVERAGRIRFDASLMLDMLGIRIGGSYGSAAKSEAASADEDPRIKALREKVYQLDQREEAEREKHFRPFQTAWTAFRSGFGVFDSALTSQPEQIALVGGVAFGNGTWRGTIDKIALMLADRDQLRESWRSKRKAFDTMREELWKQLEPLRK